MCRFGGSAPGGSSGAGKIRRGHGVVCSGVALSLGQNRRACVDAVGRVCGVRQLCAGFVWDGTAAKRRFGSCSARWKTRRMSRRIASAFRLRTRVPSMLRCGRPWGAGADGSDAPGGHMRPDGRHAPDGGAASMPACYVNLKDFKAVLPGRFGSATTRRFCYFSRTHKSRSVAGSRCFAGSMSASSS